MYDKEFDKIMQNISSSNPFLIMNAIIEGTKHNITDKRFINAVKHNKSNEETILNIPIRCIAQASLHILNIEQYIGTDNLVKRLIQTKLEF